MKDDLIRFRCSKQLKEQIEKAASDSGKSISEYITDLIKEDLIRKLAAQI
jgi:predicted HicB family RNase H-like nuclease